MRMRDALEPRAMAIGAVAALALVIDTSIPTRRDYLLEPAWTVAVYGALPLGAGLAIDASAKRLGPDPSASTRRSLGTAVLLGAGIATLLAAIGARAWLLPQGWFEARPLPMILAAAVGAALVVTGALVGRVKLDAWGVGLGDVRWWAPRFFVLMALIVPAIALAAWLSPELLSYYPEYKPARTDATILVRYQLGNGFYMLGWEYFFRGFLTFGVSRFAGAPAATVLQGLPFVLLHAGKPGLELIASYLGSVLLAAWCLRARTFVPAVLLHWGLNMTMELAGFWW